MSLGCVPWSMIQAILNPSSEHTSHTVRDNSPCATCTTLGLPYKTGMLLNDQSRGLG